MSEAAPTSRGARAAVSEEDAAGLVARYQAGDAEALAGLYERLTPAVKSILGRHPSFDLPPVISRQDLSQQSWLILADLAARWRPTGSFLAYFFRAFPLEVDRYIRRARSSRRTRHAYVQTAAHDDVLVEVDRRTSGDLLREDAVGASEYLERLPGPERAAFALKVFGDRDFEAIGRALNVSRSTAYRLYRGACARLAGGLQAPEGHPRAPADPSIEPVLSLSKGSGRAARGGDLQKLVRLLHAWSDQDGGLPGRRRVLGATGLSRVEYAQLIDRLGAAGVVVGRSAHRSGRLADRTVADSLAKLGSAPTPGEPQS